MTALPDVCVLGGYCDITAKYNELGAKYVAHETVYITDHKLN